MCASGLCGFRKKDELGSLWCIHQTPVRDHCKQLSLCIKTTETMASILILLLRAPSNRKDDLEADWLLGNQKEIAKIYYNKAVFLSKPAFYLFKIACIHLVRSCQNYPEIVRFPGFFMPFCSVFSVFVFSSNTSSNTRHFPNYLPLFSTVLYLFVFVFQIIIIFLVKDSSRQK